MGQELKAGMITHCHFASSVTITSTRSGSQNSLGRWKKRTMSRGSSICSRGISSAQSTLSGLTGMNFLLRDNNRKFSCIEYIKLLPPAPLMSVSIKEYKHNRTNSQNATFHMWCDIIGKDTGSGMEYIKDSLKLRVLGTEKRIVDGVELTEIRSSAKLDKAEFCKLMEATQLLAHQLNIILPYPDDYRMLMENA